MQDNMLQDLRVECGPTDFDSEFKTLIHGSYGRQLVLITISRETLDGLFPYRKLERPQRLLLAESNIEALGRIASAKYEADEWEPWSGYGSTLPLIEITRADIARSGEALSDVALDIADRAGFADKAGKVG
jgi:hypothetical protein